MSDKKKYNQYAFYDSANGMSYGGRFINPYGKAKKVEWEDLADSKGMLRYIRIFCVVIAVACVAAAVSYYQQLGGIEGILAAEMKATEGIEEYAVCLAGMITCPILSIVGLYFAFKKRK